MYLKCILIYLIALSLVHTVEAKCYTSGLQVWPSSKTVKSNTVFVIDAWANSQPIVSGLGSTYHAFLQADSARIPLELKEKLVGQYAMTQAVLQPSRALEVGTQYELVIRGEGTKTGNVIEYANGMGITRVFYTVEPGLDESPPTWKTLPQEKSKQYIEMGCGPEVVVDFSANILDQSACLIKATVKDLASGKINSYYLQPGTTGLVSVGHGMCVGAFMLEKGTRFSVTFALLDACGNTKAWTGKAIEFTRPLVAG